MKTKLILILTIIFALLTSCAQGQSLPDEKGAGAPPAEVASSEPEPPAESAEAEALPAGGQKGYAVSEQSPEKAEKEDLSGYTYIKNYYVLSLIDGFIEARVDKSGDSYSQVYDVYKGLVEQTAFFDNKPVGLDVWRVKGDDTNYPTIMEIRTISPLAYGIGSCEDYAAATVTICERLGIEAVYVPGLTYSVEGKLVDHAWAMVKIEGEWYHVDPQLEDNIMRKTDIMRNRYFLKGDDTMKTDHRWGTLVESPSEYSLALPECPSDYAQTMPEQIRQSPTPSRERAVESYNQAMHGYAPSSSEPYEAPELPQM